MATRAALLAVGGPAHAVDRLVGPLLRLQQPPALPGQPAERVGLRRVVVDEPRLTQQLDRRHELLVEEAPGGRAAVHELALALHDAERPGLDALGERAIE